MFCKNCGGENANNSKFCKYCGASLMPDFSEEAQSGSYETNTYNAPSDQQGYYDASAQNYDYQPQQTEAGGKSVALSVVSMILGILSLVLIIFMADALHILTFTGLPCAIVAVILSGKDKQNNGSNGFNKAGKICGIIGIVLNAILCLVGWIVL